MIGKLAPRVCTLADRAMRSSFAWTRWICFEEAFADRQGIPYRRASCRLLHHRRSDKVVGRHWRILGRHLGSFVCTGGAFLAGSGYSCNGWSCGCRASLLNLARQTPRRRQLPKLAESRFEQPTRLGGGRSEPGALGSKASALLFIFGVRHRTDGGTTAGHCS